MFGKKELILVEHSTNKEILQIKDDYFWCSDNEKKPIADNLVAHEELLEKVRKM